MNTSIECYNELIAAVQNHDTLEHVCRLYACYILACAGGNVSRASRTLGVHRRTLHRWQREKLHAMGEGYVTV